ncbi:hypothetical protein BKA81DRAFT_421473 [Phyllosticta paracitricarpa]|uniref:Integrase zinc-binding domain-containing protein n=1 Tax=Phyllosticta paracitricarpa TaxID=2016321 RepID=A0ABR1MZC4_9PEZI
MTTDEELYNNAPTRPNGPGSSDVPGVSNVSGGQETSSGVHVSNPDGFHQGLDTVPPGTEIASGTPTDNNAPQRADIWASRRAYSGRVDAAVDSGRPCTNDNHVHRTAGCKECSVVAFIRIHRSRMGGLRSTSNRSTSHKVDLPTLDTYEEWTAMKEAEKRDELKSSTAFNQFVDGKLGGRTRTFDNPQKKNWVKANIFTTGNGVGLCWGNPNALENPAPSGKGKGKTSQRQVELEGGDKVAGVILYDVKAAELVHEIHERGHCGRDSLVKEMQSRGYKPPVKATVNEWIKDCPGCARTNKKRTLDAASAQEASEPAAKRRKAAQWKPKVAVAAAEGVQQHTPANSSSLAPSSPPTAPQVPQVPIAGLAAPTLAPPLDPILGQVQADNEALCAGFQAWERENPLDPSSINEAAPQ